MKSLPAFCLSLLLSSVAWGQCPPQYQLSENLLQNSSFSGGNEGFATQYKTNVNMILEGAFAISSDANSVFRDFAGRGRNGTNDAFMIVNGSTVRHKIVWGQRIAVLPNTTYLFGMWLTNLVPTNLSRLRVYINGEPLRSTAQPLFEVGQWKEYTETWESGKSNVAYVEIECITTQKIGNDFGIDDLSFRACLPQGTEHLAQRAQVTASLCGKNYAMGGELLLNPQFEEGSIGFSTAYAKRYTLAETGSYAIDRFSLHLNSSYKGRGHSGDYDFFMQVNGATEMGKKVWAQTVSVLPNQRHSFSGWVVPLTEYTPALLEIRIDGKPQGRVEVDGAQYQWKPFAVEWESGNKRMIEVSLHSLSTDKVGNDFGLDDLSFRACIPKQEAVTAQQTAPTPVPEEIPPAIPQETKVEKDIMPKPQPSLKQQYEEAILSGEKLVLTQVQFAQGQYVLLSESQRALQQLAEVLQRNPATRIKLTGHTDNQGDADKNLRLSQRRVLVCKNFLITQGIAEERIETEAKGETEPIAPNTTEAGRSQNRRVEIDFKKE